MRKWLQTVIPKDYPVEKFLDSPYFLGSVEKDNSVIAYFSDDEEVHELLRDLKLSIITEDDWEEKWRDYFIPIPFAGFTVVPPWLKEKGDLIINPSRGFGTGHHETTRLCASFFRSLLSENSISSMADIGTGSGILSIASRLLRRDLRIDAVDVDPDAIENLEENLSLNGISDISFKVGSVETLTGPYDVVVANIISSILLSISDGLKNLTGRYLILSGILLKERNLFLDQMDLSDFTLVEERDDGEWCAFLYMRKDV